MHTAIYYLEKPVTRPEKEIANLLTTLQSAIKTRNWEKLKEFYSLKASIEINGRFINREQFIENIQKHINVIGVSIYKDVLIRIYGQNLAKVYYSLQLSSSIINTNKKIDNRIITLIKNGSWHIGEVRQIK
ncbi:MAG: hypothetical protein HYT39_02600 [Candidatus Sungbacteria bacterium]|nr:hypothetical protein [Candidatus Sungbacteria bacterium]